MADSAPPEGKEKKEWWKKKGGSEEAADEAKPSVAAAGESFVILIYRFMFCSFMARLQTKRLDEDREPCVRAEL